MNSICFDIFTIGNHEFDDGDAGLAKFLDYLNAGPCNTSVLSSNVIPKIGTALAPHALGDYIRPWVSTAGTRLGAAVAVVSGVTIKSTTMMSSSPLPTTVFLDEVAAAQAAIDEATARGFTRIVLATHQGYDADLALAAQLRGVDAIIGGHSHSLLGDGAGLGLETKGPYPTPARDRDGRLVCVAQAWEFAKAFGRLRVGFGPGGDVLSCEGEVVLPIPPFDLWSNHCDHWSNF